MRRIILASGSSRRSELLEMIGVTAEVIPSNADEDGDFADVEEMVRELSLRKACEVETRINAAPADGANPQPTPPYIIIAADTVVALGGQIFGKPKDNGDAAAMIAQLAGRQHSVYSGVTLISAEPRETVTFTSKTDVWVRPMTSEQIQDFINTVYVLDASGSYKIQSKFAAYVERIEGEYTNIMGLPLCALMLELERLCLDIQYVTQINKK